MPDEIDQIVRDNTKTLTTIAQELVKVEARIVTLEKAEIARTINEARQDERHLALQKRLDGFDTTLNKILGTGKNGLWLAIAAVITVVVKWVMEGGMAPG